MHDDPFKIALAQGEAIGKQFKRSDWRGPIWVMIALFCGVSWVAVFRIAEYLVYLGQVART